MSERNARDLVAALISEQRLPIGSHPSAGFFWIETARDRELACRHLESRGLKILQRLSILKKVSVREAAVQLSLLEGQ